MTARDEDVVRCRRCRRVTPPDELDGILWCEECVEAEGRRAARWGRRLALAGAVLLAVWIALALRPAGPFRYLYALVLIVALVLGARLATALVYGVARVRNRPGAREDAAATEAAAPDDG